MPNIINFMIRSNCLESYNELLFIMTVTFSTFASVCLEFLWTVTSETIPKKIATAQFV